MKLVDRIAGEIIEGAEQDVLRVMLERMLEEKYYNCHIGLENGEYFIRN